MKGLLVSFLIVNVIFSYSQSGKVDGVIMRRNEKPLPYATVLYFQEGNQDPISFAISKDDGSFSLSIPEVNRRGRISITAINFKKHEIVVLPNDTILKQYLVVYLEQDIHEIEPVVISAPPITIKGDTTTFIVKSFIKGDEQNIGDLLKNMPGFKVDDNGKLSFNGQRVKKVLLENDDLIGANYQYITQNLSPDALEKVQVIENYKSEEDIIASMQTSGELVVNLGFKKEYLLKVFGKVDVALGLPLPSFNTKNQLVSLISDIKVLAICKANNVGNVVNNTSISNTNQSNEPNGENGQDLIEGYYSTITPVQMQSGYFNPINANTTLDNALFGKVKLAKNIFFKANSQYYKDKFYQTIKDQRVWYTPTSTIWRSQLQESKFLSTLSNHLFSINWVPQPKNQIIANFRISFLNSKNSDKGSLLLNPYSINTNTWEKLLNGEIVYNKIFNSANAIRLTAKNATSTQSNFFDNDYSELAASFFSDTAISSVRQNENWQSDRLSVDLKYMYKSAKTAINFSVSHDNTKQRYQNEVFGMGNQIQRKLGMDSSLLGRLHTKRLIAAMNFSRVLGKFKLTADLKWINYIAPIFSLRLSKQIHYQKFIPALSIRHKISASEQVTVSYTQNVVDLDLYQINNGFVVSGLNSYIQNTNLPQINRTSQTTVTYNNTKTANNGLWFFGGGSYIRNVNTSVNNQFIDLYVNRTVKEVFSKPSNLGIAYANLSKRLKNNLISLGVRSNFVYSNFYLKLQNVLKLYHFYSTSIGLDCSANLGKWNLKTNSNMSYKWQKSSIPTQGVTKNWWIDNRSAIIYKVSDKAYFNFNYSGFLSKASVQKASFTSSFNAHVQFKMKKSTIYLSANNLFNEKSTDFLEIMPNSFSSLSYSIFPRNILLGLQFNF